MGLLKQSQNGAEIRYRQENRENDRPEGVAKDELQGDERFPPGVDCLTEGTRVIIIGLKL